MLFPPMFQHARTQRGTLIFRHAVNNRWPDFKRVWWAAVLLGRGCQQRGVQPLRIKRVVDDGARQQVNGGVTLPFAVRPGGLHERCPASPYFLRVFVFGYGPKFRLAHPSPPWALLVSSARARRAWH